MWVTVPACHGSPENLASERMETLAWDTLKFNKHDAQGHGSDFFHFLVGILREKGKWMRADWDGVLCHGLL